MIKVNNNQKPGIMKNVDNNQKPGIMKNVDNNQKPGGRMWVDGRGGKREGAGRPKLSEQKKAFRVTEHEKNLIKTIRTLDAQGVIKLMDSLHSIEKKHRQYRW